MGKIGRFVILIFIIYAWALGYCLCTLLKTCEGENLQDCVNKAESMLQDPNMTFPDDNETLQSVCRMWEDMTGCTYNYTSRCLTRKENEEFHQYFKEPMTSMKTVCTDKQSSEEYFRHAHCIKRISTGENYCGTQYQIMIDQIISVTVNSMKKICCSMRDFKECVMTMNANHVCREGPYEDRGFDGDIGTYAVRTLDKSLLAFVTHSCAKEGFNGHRCMMDDEGPNDLSQLMEERSEPSAQFTHAESLGNTDENIQMDMSMTMSQTQKPLLVPLSPLPYDYLHQRMRVNVTVTGNRGKTFMGRSGPYPPDDTHYTYGNDVATGRSLRDKDVPMGYGGVTGTLKENQLLLEAKIRNMSSWYQPFPRPQDQGTPTTMHGNNGNTNENNMHSNTIALAERRIDSDNSKGANVNAIIAQGNDHLQHPTQDISPSTSSMNSSFNGTHHSRINAGRSLNFLESSLTAEENTLLGSSSSNNGVVSGNDRFSISNPTLDGSSQDAMSNTNPATATLTAAASTTPSMMNSQSATGIKTGMSTTSTATTSTTTTATTTTTTTATTTTKASMNNNAAAAVPDENKPMSPDGPKMDKNPRILNTGVGIGSSSAGTLSQTPGTTKLFAPPSTTIAAPTTTVPSTKNVAFPGKSEKGDKGKKKALLDIANTTMKTDESKNAGNFSVSDVPIKVFMVWLSTFFV